MKPSALICGAVLIAVGWAFPSTASAQKYDYIGPNKCYAAGCHKEEKDWYKTKDGTNGRRHSNSDGQLENIKSKEYAKALGLADPYDAKCTKCHATTFKNNFAGVSCESCHGPGSGYLEVHDDMPGGYEKSLALGMLDVWTKPQTWAPQCMECHVVSEAALIKAGHPSGDEFDLGVKLTPVAIHWKKSNYSAGQIAPLGAAAKKQIQARRGSAPATTAAAAPPPAAPPPVAPEPPPVAPATTPTPAPAPPPAAPSPAPAPSAAAPPPAIPPAPASRPPAAPGPRPTPPAARPPAAGAPMTPPLPLPSPPMEAPVVAGPAAIPLPPPDANVPVLPRTPTGVVASIQGRLAALLERLLASGARSPQRVAPPEKKTEYRGADAELLRLQDEVIALALEALGVAPSTPGQAKPQP